MTQGWKQVLEDMRHALLGGAPTGEADVAAAPLTSSGATKAVGADAKPSLGSGEPSGPGAEGPVPLSEQEDTLAVDAASQEVEVADAKPRSRFEQVAITVLILAGLVWLVQASGLWAWWTEPTPPAPDVIATFDGGQITIADVETHLDLLTSEESTGEIRSPQTMMWVVEDMVLDELVTRWAAGRKPDADETFGHTMQHISEDINLQSFEDQLHDGEIPVAESEIQAYYNSNLEEFGGQPLSAVREQIRAQLVVAQEADYLDNYIVRLKDNASIARYFELLDVPAPSEDELRSYYEENREQFRLPRQVIVDEARIPTGEDEAAARQDVADVLLKLRSGVAWSDVAQTFPRATMFTGNLVTEGARDPAWDAELAELTEGELSDVFSAGDSLYIVRLQERRENRIQSFEEARRSIEPIVAARVAEDWFSTNAVKTLFTLKGNRYTVGEFYREYQELPLSFQTQYAGADGMIALAERLIERLLLVEDANDRLLDVQNEPLVDEARLQVLKQMLHQEEVDEKIEITDEEIQQYYEQNRYQLVKEPKARIRYIRIGLGNSEDEAEQARLRIDEAYRKLNPGLFQSGADFAVVAQEYSEDPETAAAGGELPGWIGGDEGVIATPIEQHAFNDRVLSLGPSVISSPFQFGDSLYVVQVIERTEPEPFGLDEVRLFIEEFIRQQRHEEQTLGLQQRLLDQANFQIYWSVLEDYFKQLEPM